MQKAEPRWGEQGTDEIARQARGGAAAVVVRVVFDDFEAGERRIAAEARERVSQLGSTDPAYDRRANPRRITRVERVEIE